MKISNYLLLGLSLLMQSCAIRKATPAEAKAIHQELYASYVVTNEQDTLRGKLAPCGFGSVFPTCLTLTDTTGKTSTGTYLLASGNTQLILDGNTKTPFYINSITDKTLEMGLLSVNPSKAVSTLTDEENNSLFISGILLGVANVDAANISPTPKTMQAVWVLTAK